MDMSTVKVILALASTWGVGAKHDDIANACVTDDKEADLHILLKGPKGWLSAATLSRNGMQKACVSLCYSFARAFTGLNRREGCGANCYMLV